ncbi:hypothetical protein DFQ30_002133, partial [Apophysomyces sp. BC1015]
MSNVAKNRAADGTPAGRADAAHRGVPPSSHRTGARRAAPVPNPVPPITFPEALPVSGRRDEIAAAISQHPVVIVSGETGSGKTTQLPKICLALGRGLGAGGTGLIGHTQPRRIAASATARRIAEELGTPFGDVVGYKVRFTDNLSAGASVKLMTDGILLAETQTDPLLRAYDTIIIDEAHERSLNIDFLLGHLKQILPRRPDLKLIVTSATIDAQRFACHFGSNERPAPVIEVSGRLYPVQIRYQPVVGDDARAVAAGGGGAAGSTGSSGASASAVGGAGAVRQAERDLHAAIVDAVDERCREGPTAQASSAAYRDPAAVRAAIGARAGARVQARQCATHRAGDQRCRDVADGAGHSLRGRYGTGAREALFVSEQGRAIADRAG